MARGSVVPRPTTDGKKRYRIKWESRGPDGTRVYHSATRRTKDEADRFLADKLKEVNDGTFVVASKETIGQFLHRWLDASAPRWAEATQYGHSLVVTARIEPRIGAVPLARLDALTIQAFYAELTEAGYAPSTVGETHAVLNAALKRAVAWRILPRNPMDGVTPPAKRTKAPRVWSAAQAATFLEKTKDHRLNQLWRLGLDSGMRLGELLVLSWDDLDLDRGVVAVRRTLTRRRDRGWKIGDVPKTSSSRRSIVIGPATVSALRSLRPKQAQRRLRCGAAWVDYGLVFDRGNGEWLAPATVQAAFERDVTIAKVPELTPHGMRHTMATILLAAGVHPKVVQERLGHSSIQMTLDRYSHVTTSMQQDAADVLDGLIGDGARPGRGQDAG
jgi:integrase